MTVMLTLGRSEAMFEGEWEGVPRSSFYPQPIPDDVPGGVVTIGPFEYVEITYDMLRVGPEGASIGRFKDDLWWLDGDPYPFSDLDVYHEEKEERISGLTEITVIAGAGLATAAGAALTAGLVPFHMVPWEADDDQWTLYTNLESADIVRRIFHGLTMRTDS